MVRSKWTTIALIAGLASLSLALASTGRGAQAPGKLPAGMDPTKVISISEPGKPPQQWLIQKTTRQSDGKVAHEIRSLATGEVTTVYMEDAGQFQSEPTPAPWTKSKSSSPMPDQTVAPGGWGPSGVAKSQPIPAAATAKPAAASSVKPSTQAPANPLPQTPAKTVTPQKAPVLAPVSAKPQSSAGPVLQSKLAPIHADAIRTVDEPGKPPLQCRTVMQWRTPEGLSASQLQAITTGEYLTIVESGDVSTSGGPANNSKVPAQLYHWGASKSPPPGVPVPYSTPPRQIAPPVVQSAKFASPPARPIVVNDAEKYTLVGKIKSAFGGSSASPVTQPMPTRTTVVSNAPKTMTDTRTTVISSAPKTTSRDTRPTVISNAPKTAMEPLKVPNPWKNFEPPMPTSKPLATAKAAEASKPSERPASVEPMKFAEQPSTPEIVKAPEVVKTPEPVKASEPVKTPELAKTPEPVAVPELMKAPELMKVPETVKAPEPVHVPEPVKAPEPVKTPEPAKAPELSVKAPEPVKTQEPLKTPELKMPAVPPPPPASETSPMLPKVPEPPKSSVSVPMPPSYVPPPPVAPTEAKKQIEPSLKPPSVGRPSVDSTLPVDGKASMAPSLPALPSPMNGPSLGAMPPPVAPLASGNSSPPLLPGVGSPASPSAAVRKSDPLADPERFLPGRMDKEAAKPSIVGMAKATDQMHLPLGAGSVAAAGDPRFVPVPMVTVPQGNPPRPPMLPGMQPIAQSMTASPATQAPAQFVNAFTTAPSEGQQQMAVPMQQPMMPMMQQGYGMPMMPVPAQTSYRGPLPPNPFGTNQVQTMPMMPMQGYGMPMAPQGYPMMMAPQGYPMPMMPMQPSMGNPNPAMGRFGAAASSSPTMQHSVNAIQSSIFPTQREMAVWQLSMCDPSVNPQVVQLLLTTAKADQAPMVRAACVNVLARMGVASDAAQAVYVQLKTDADPRVRHEAEQALARTSAPSNVQPVSAINRQQ